MVDLHLIFTDYEQFGFSVTSPQIPGLVATYNTIDEALDQVPNFAALVDDVRETWLHTEKVAFAPSGDEYLIRFLSEPKGEYYEQRIDCAQRLFAAVTDGNMAERATHQPQLVTSERLLVAVHGDDTIGWCLDQIDKGEGMTLERQTEPDLIYAISLVDKDLEEGSKTLDELGLSRSSTIAELFDNNIAAEAADLRVAIHA